MIKANVNAYTLKKCIIYVLNLYLGFCAILSFPCHSCLDIQSDQGQTEWEFRQRIWMRLLQVSGKNDQNLAGSPRAGRPSGWLGEKPVGEGLRKAYRAVADEPIPEKMQKLIDELKRRECDKG